MGWCHEFVCQVAPDCDHPMTAGENACTCNACDEVCTGRFGGCPDVWGRGPKPLHLIERRPPPAAVTIAPDDEAGVAAMVDNGFDPSFEEQPAPADPAAEVLAWLRGEFDDVNASLRALSDRLTRQEAAVLQVAGSQEAELNVSLAELEGCAAKLRNEAVSLGDTRAALVESLPGLVAEAVRPAVAAGLDAAVAELRTAVSQLGAALAEALPAAVVDAVAPAMVAPPAPAAPMATIPPDDEAPQGDLVSQLHQAQDEAAEWFSIVVDEAVRRAVERWLPRPAPAPAPPAPPAPAFASTAAATTSATAEDAEAVPAQPPPGEDQASAPEPVLSPAGEEVGGQADLSGEVDGGGGVSSVAQRPDTAEATPETEDLTVANGAGVAGPSALLGPRTASSAAVPPGPAGPVTVGEPAMAGEAPQAEETDVPGDGDSAIACVLPGVAVGPTLALGVSTALRRARLRRRRRRQAGAPSAGLFRHDPLVGELSRRLERFALARRGLAWSANGSGTPGAAVVAGERHGQEVAVDLTAGPIALVGAEAAAAGRALVTTFLATREPGVGRVVATGDVLPVGPSFPGLERAPSLAAALDDLEAETARRAADLTADGNGDGRGGAGADPPVGDRPFVVLVTSAVPAELAGRLLGLVNRGTPVGMTALVVGEALEGATTVTLQPGGAVAAVSSSDQPDLSGSRFYSLATEAAAELLEVLAAARTDDDAIITSDPDDEPFPVLVGPALAPIQVRVLGPYRIHVAGKEIRSGLRAKARELLAFYLLHPEGTTLDAATEALWPEADPGRGSEWFWTALGNLRSLLRSATGIKALKIIERDGDRYRIEPVFDVDLWRFQAALPPSGASTGDPEWAATLQPAANLYSGELLADVDWAWAEVPREDLRRRAVDVLVSLAATRLVTGDVRGALDSLSRAVEVDPLAEQLYRRIMRLHANQSRPDEVEATFRRLKTRLGELDLEPTADSEQLVTELCR